MIPSACSVVSACSISVRTVAVGAVTRSGTLAKKP